MTAAVQAIAVAYSSLQFYRKLLLFFALLRKRVVPMKEVVSSALEKKALILD